MKRKRCSGCRCYFGKGDRIFKFPWFDKKLKKEVMMEWCDFCYGRRKQGIPIKGFKPEKEKYAKVETK